MPAAACFSSWRRTAGHSRSSCFARHNSLNRNRFKDKIMQQFKILQRPLRVRKDARRCNMEKPGAL
ncbi:hypothetical protein GFL58_22650 [Rhizobium leguminosarum bv. viciae]|nr:hypothetical protein [Rhizobium leguminosarum bv. viciae]NKM63760.1 hypothetical protein [Rhizobium leguminosarum bv. viciae]